MVKMPKKERALGMYKDMYLIRQYEEAIYYLFLEGIMPGTIHQSHGQEACAVGMIYDLRKEDYILTTHRPAGHDLAKGVSLRSMMCEMFGKAEGCCKGKGGAMHTGDISVGAITANAIVGGNLPIAAGVALRCKMLKTDNVAVCFFGDGASNEGAFHEALNAAAVWKLPVVYVCENNLYSATTSIKMTTAVENVAADRGSAYGIPSEVVDGNDVLAVNEAAKKAIKRARDGKGPTILELKTYRIGGHSRNDACGYRPKEEEAEWFSRDPVTTFRNRLLAEGVASEEELQEVEGAILAEIDEEIEYAKNAPEPQPEDALTDVYWEGGIA
ncbi:thiamine pyrophosphate-dependent dehydrogenase E1 component subunit alpha [Ohessyouella blattaphilus]|uniref:Thiamine pyrophosphate-dependent dehydrogenase E1 component subunit alpha n=1 Tax=Ohessyouella blattaphilus TaxID=2949333 RepID=A0ABT1EGW8_9FIRM|nr:thiamine pyrophosphate-dependent dehydrogenase E1 component subunit alpha [Ohessyouella blattaphilus]MCP1108931.1 thiamine pyrophosphate-dependent dehydrogenase E1 component subunit alpha [Ohessyouella blattaphilus]MCR8562325.1 thiamine pyrophosphate-dependent dehydrogenase E1 component subunit alpha [Ohessyouella blattaphilus]MDL2249018.1 thiamine pyrophosphate-dependent dehydrogenase E1 component subunit alpha [Lachnospiraceae bacterium OttesenSCG-928-J05]